MKQALYRWYDKKHVLLYVGISGTLMSRIKAHKDNSHWFYKSHYMTVEWFDTRTQAEAAERLAIENEGPLHNISHDRGKNTEPSGWVYKLFRKSLRLDTEINMQKRILEVQLESTQFQLDRAGELIDAMQASRTLIGSGWIIESFDARKKNRT